MRVDGRVCFSFVWPTCLEIDGTAGMRCLARPRVVVFLSGTFIVVEGDGKYLRPQTQLGDRPTQQSPSVFVHPSVPSACPGREKTGRNQSKKTSENPCPCFIPGILSHRIVVVSSHVVSIVSLSARPPGGHPGPDIIHFPLLSLCPLSPVIHTSIQTSTHRFLPGHSDPPPFPPLPTRPLNLPHSRPPAGP